MKGIIGKKVGMTQLIRDDGIVANVTIVEAGPCFVTQVKTLDRDGYEAIQVGYGEVKASRLSRGELGHLGLLEKGKKRVEAPVRRLREFRTRTAGEYELGQELTVDQFSVGDSVDVTGVSKGRGFAGGMKRHGFSGGPITHGQSDRQRSPGSIGATSGMSRVIKGMKMAGRMGNDRVTTQGLKVAAVDAERNLIAVEGSVPGAKGGLVVIRNAVKG